MNKEINRRKFLKWVGIASVSAGLTFYSKPSFSSNTVRVGADQMVDGKKTCPHNFCRYYMTFVKDDEEIGYCSSRVYCR